MSILVFTTQDIVCPTPIIPPILDKSVKGSILQLDFITSTSFLKLMRIPYTFCPCLSS